MTTTIKPAMFRLMIFAAAWAVVVGLATARAMAQTPAPADAPAASAAPTTGRATAVQVANAGKRAIVAVYTSAPGRDDWGSDMLGKQTLKPGGTADLKLTDKSAACRLDFSALLDNGDTRTRGDVNVCSAAPQVGF